MTQEYTPVSWQDETTSQQGTLINAERLNQMQTAHHYADGFEEVDTAPTADPGVGYHKVVYCTADSTFYRWDGTQWTADIDDDTKALLLAHEADHANPHEVTKAQVGLGNADNTSDLDKPISTATQTALNAKADKSDTYTKAQTDTLLGGKVDKQDSSAGMIAYTAEEGTEGSTEINAGAKPATIPIRTADGRLRAYFDDADPYADDCVTYTWTSGQLADIRGTLDYKADKATTLAGYGITDAYTKAEADTLLGAKADQATTYTKSEVQTYVSDALDGYLPMVRTTDNQDITGFKNNMSMGVANLAIGGSTARWIRLAYSTISDAALAGYVMPDKQTGINASMKFELVGRYNSAYFKATNLLGNLNTALYALTYDGTTYELWYHYPENTTNWRVTVCIRGSNTGREYILDGTTTKESLDAADYTWLVNPTLESNNLVHRTGNETIDGAKTFTGAVYLQNRAELHSNNPFLRICNTGITRGTTPSTVKVSVIRFEDINNVEVATIGHSYFADGDSTIRIGVENTLATGGSSELVIANKSNGEHFIKASTRGYVPGNTTDVATIGTLDAYTPMVRTTGNQDIGGIKTFTDPPAGHRTNSRTNAYAGYYTIMKLGLRGDGTNRQVLGGLISQHFGMIQINEPNATSINVTDLMGTFSSLLDFALYTDGSYHYVAVKQKTNNTFAYELALMAANKGNYGLNSGDIQVYYTLSAVDSNWTLVASTEGA